LIAISVAEDDALWAAFADPTRRRVLEALLEKGEATTTTLAEGLPITRQAVAKHLVVLNRVGLVAGQRRGREVRYAVQPERLDDAADSMARVAAQWDGRLTRIKRLAESLQVDTASLADLFKGRSQLLVYHFMFGPDYTAGCPSCSAIADGFSGSVVHLANHDVALTAVSRAPLEKLQAYKQRMGWSFPWASSFESDFNYDFNVSHTQQEWQSGAVDYNFGTADYRPAEQSPVLIEIASGVGTDPATYRKEGPGISAFALEDGVVFHTYSAYARGVDGLWGMYAWLDRAPLGRNETGLWWRRHDEYDED